MITTQFPFSVPALRITRNYDKKICVCVDFQA